MTTLLLNGRIHSPFAVDATAMAVRDGHVVWIGSDAVGVANFPDATRHDLHNGFVAPAFVDSHFHVTATGLTLTGLDLRPATSQRQCLDLLRDYVATHRDGPVWGHGWDDTAWADGGAPTTAELDAAAPGRAVYLARVDVHSAAASTPLRALAPELSAAAGYDPARPLTADAHHRVRAVARDLLTPAQRAAARGAALDAAAANGIVAVHECAGPQIGGLDDWRELRATRHGVDVVGYWGEAVSDQHQARELVDATGARGLAGDLFVDGALGSHTAWLREPYADAPGTCGNTYLDADAVTAHLLACTQVGVPAGFHAIGDAAVTVVVDAIEHVAAALGGPAVARCGHRIEHVEMVSPEQADILAARGVIVSVQPTFDALWGGDTGMYAQRLGVERAAALNPLALLASRGVPMAFGSDSPVTTLDPWVTVRAATAHHTPGSAISARAAFAAATRGAWRASGVNDGVTGTLVPGAPASYAVWDVGDLTVSAPADAVQRWSTEKGSRVPQLPALGPDDPLPVCRQTVHRGVQIHG